MREGDAPRKCKVKRETEAPAEPRGERKAQQELRPPLKG